PIFNANGVRLEGSRYVAELYGGLLPDSLTPALNTLGNRVITPFYMGIGAGYFQNVFVQLPGVVIGTPAWLQVRAWDTTLGATYEEALVHGQGGYGESILLYLPSGGAG